MESISPQQINGSHLHHVIILITLLRFSHELNTLDACWIAVDVWSNSSRCRIVSVYLMPIFMIIALDIIITMRFSINCSAVICSPTVLFSILREASSETYGPWVYFPSYKFPIYNFSFLFTFFAIFGFPFHKPKNTKNITLPFIHLYQISLCE